MQRASPVVAVVEDDASMRRSIERLLTVHGFGAEAFSSAEAFLENDHIDRLSCLVLDIQLPGMSGLELYARTVASGLKLPTVFITGDEDDEFEAAAERLGCVAYLQKPFPTELLISAVNRAVAARPTP